MSNHCLSTNLAIIEQRWPNLLKQLEQIDVNSIDVESLENTLLIDGKQLTSNIDREHEALVQTAHIPNHAQTIYVYGSALGDSILALLANKPNTKIQVVIMNKAIFIHSLNVIDHSVWLAHECVTLNESQNITDVLSPFCVSPLEIRMPDQQAEQLTDRIQLEINHEFIIQQHMSSEQQRKRPLKNNMEYIVKDNDYSHLEKFPPEVFIAAAGPTLEQHFNFLKKNSPFIVAVDAAVRPLLKQGIIPNIVVSIDYTAFQFFKDIPNEVFANVPLVYFPNVDSQVLNYWPTTRHCCYSNTPMYQSLIKTHPKKTLFSAGSVIHPAIDLAVKLEAKSIILLGADFAFTQGKSHAGDHASHALNMSIAQERITNGLGEKVPTMMSLKGYLRDLERYIERNQQVKFYNSSLQGAHIEGATLWNAI